MRKLILLPVLFFFVGSAYAGHAHLEKWYQVKWCGEAGGVMEYRLEDGARVDCLTSTHAIEFDFAPKWAESIGQALYYGLETGKDPGVVLIMDPVKDGRFLDRLRRVSEKYGVKVWIMTE